MKKILIVILFGFIASCTHNEIPRSKKIVVKGKDYLKEIQEIIDFSTGKNYSKDYCILVDFDRSSSLDRFFLVHIPSKTIMGTYQSQLAHGAGCGSRNGKPRGFSNIPESNCSSLGFALIQEKAYSNWGNHYKYWLKGLSETNSNLRKRVVVLHSLNSIKENSGYITESLGCFALSNYKLDLLDKFIQDNRLSSKLLIYAFK